MRAFPLCPACRREYEDPADRRFHAEPNACPVCGPRVRLVRLGDGGEVVEVAAGGAADPAAPIRAAAELLRDGEILAVKGLGGFHLACDATDGEAVRRLKRRKRRPDKPLAVMLRDVDELRAHCRVTPEEESLLTSPEHPIVLLEWRDVGTWGRAWPGARRGSAGWGRRRPDRPGGRRPPALPRRDAAVHAAARAAARGGGPAAGHDQRQPRRGADRQGLGGHRPPDADRRRVPGPRPGDRRALRRLRRSGAEGSAAADPPVEGLRPLPGGPAAAAAADARRRRGAQEHLLPHARRQRLPQPAHRRPREPGDARALRDQHRGVQAAVPPRPRAGRVRPPSGVPGDQVRARAAAAREGRRAAPPRARGGAAGRARAGRGRHRREHGRPRLRRRRPPVGRRGAGVRPDGLPPGRPPRGAAAAGRRGRHHAAVADGPRLELRAPRARGPAARRRAARGRGARRAQTASPRRRTKRSRRWSPRSTAASTRRSPRAAGGCSTRSPRWPACATASPTRGRRRSSSR